MTRETEQIEQDIRNLQNRRTEAPVTPSGNVRGYTVAVTILTDLFGCIFIGFVLGLFLNRFFQTGVLMTAGLTLLGGVAGLYTTIRYALRQERKNQ